MTLNYAPFPPVTDHAAPAASAVDRRALLKAGLGMLLAAGFPSTALASPAFSSPRMTVSPRGGITGPKGRDIILIPGLASGPAVWNGLINGLSGHRFHLIHIAGFAHSAPGPNGEGPLLRPLADEIARYIRTQRLGKPVIIGHSMGGTLAMMLALRTDISVDRAMVVDMLPEGAAMIGGTAQGMGFMAQQLNGYLTGTRAGRQILARMVTQFPGAEGSDPQVIAHALSELAHTDLKPQLRSIRCPLHIVYALSADKAVADSQKRHYETAYADAPAARLTGISPSGHAVMLDQPVRFATIVKEFLK